MTEPRISLRLALVATALAVLAACGSAGGESKPGSAELNSPPFELGVNTRIWGVGSDRLFVLDGRRAAAYDFAEREWRRLPDAPDLARVEVTSVDDTVLLLGSDCDGPCGEDERAPIGVAALDLTGDGGWTERDAGLGSVESYDVGFRDHGQAGNERILGHGTGLLTLTADAQLRTAASADLRDFATCKTGAGMLSLVPDAPAPLPADPMLAPICGGRGVLVMTGTQTMEWDSRAWTVHDSAPEGPVVNGLAVVTRSGTVVAQIGGGNIAVYSDGAWRTVRVATGTVMNPPIVSVAAVGDHIVVFDAPRAESETGTLKTVEV